MSNDSRPDSQKSRQDLLDEIYYLRDVAGERGHQIQERDRLIIERDTALESLRDQLDLILRSRSWRMTAPFRWIRAGIHHLRGAMMDSSAAAQDDAPVREPWSSSDVKSVPTQSHVPLLVEDRGDGKRRLYVDITELASREGRTGVQRVVRGILRGLLVSPPDGFTIEPVSAAPGQPYRHLRTSTVHLMGGAISSDPDAPIDARAGDVFVGLDHAMQAVIDHAGFLEQMRKRGVHVWFVCNDTLPLSRPDWFPPEVHETFMQWFQTIARVGDGIACISRTTEGEVRRWIETLSIKRERPLALGHFHLGADFDPDASLAALKPEEQADIERLRGKKTFLMVGTLEPRKGHAQALEAFNLLWAGGVDVSLIIAGLPGWMTEVVQRRIRHHDEFGRHLFWFMDASDALLETLYATCTALLAPSEGEGFGLPLIEAARHGLPILCRDLPVFREMVNGYASFFDGSVPASLADAVRSWLTAYREGSAPSSTGMRGLLTWEQSTRNLLEIVLGGKRDVSWMPMREEAQ